MKPTIIFVHPTLSVSFLFQQVKQKGYRILSIITSLESTKIDHSFLSEHSDFIISGGNDPAADLEKIKQLIALNHLNIVAILNGIDAALYYNDFLQKAILGYDIDLSASKIRQNKYAVNHRLNQHHLTIIPSVEITSKQELNTKMDAIQKLGLPIVAKPSEDTAAMSAFEIVQTIDGLSAYLDQYLGKANTYYSDQVIKKIILQQYIPLDSFEEFAIDFISYQGKHYCCGILYYDKAIVDSSYKIYRYYVPYIVDEQPHIKTILTYLSDCLTALDVRYGFTHNEVFWNKSNNQYYLIESNNRMAGNGIIEAYQNVYGYNPLSAYLKLLNNESIEPYPIVRNGYSIIMDLYNLSTAHASKINIEDLPSFQKIIHFRNPKQNAPDFYKQFTRAQGINAAALLNNASQTALQRDIDIILEREANGTLFLK